MSEAPASPEPHDVVRADELEGHAKPSRFGRRLMALTFVGLVAAFFVSVRPWESETLDDPNMPADQTDYVHRVHDYFRWLYDYHWAAHVAVRHTTEQLAFLPSQAL